MLLLDDVHQFIMDKYKYKNVHGFEVIEELISMYKLYSRSYKSPTLKMASRVYIVVKHVLDFPRTHGGE